MITKKLRNYIKTKKSTSEQLVKIVFCIVVILAIILLIYINNKKQQALYDQYLETAQQHLSDDNMTETIENFTKAIKIYPNDPLTYGLRAFAYYANNQNEEALKDTDKILSLTKDIPAPIFNLRGDIFSAEDKLEPAVEAFSIAYTLSQSEAEYVSDYVRSLMYKEQYEKGYDIVKKYFDEIPKDVYWDDVEIWLDMGITSLQTHRCLEAIVSGHHILQRLDKDDDLFTTAEDLVSSALNDENCIDTENGTKPSIKNVKEAVAKTEAFAPN